MTLAPLPAIIPPMPEDAPASAPPDLQAMFEAVEAALGDGRWEDARAAADGLLAHVPDHPQVLVLRGVAEMQAGRFSAAERTLTHAAAVEPPP